LFGEPPIALSAFLAPTAHLREQEDEVVEDCSPNHRCYYTEGYEASIRQSSSWNLTNVNESPVVKYRNIVFLVG